MCFDETVGRLIELSERKRREQLEAPRALLFSDRERGFESFFGLRRVGGITLQQDILPRSRCRLESAKPIPAFLELITKASSIPTPMLAHSFCAVASRPRKSAKKARNYDPIALIPIIRQRFAEVI